MHHLSKILPILSIILLLNACSGHTLQELADETIHQKTLPENEKQYQPTPSQNSQLNAVSPSPTALSEGGSMQKSLDQWTEEKWTPSVEKNETIKMMNEEKARPFTLQEYVDKAIIYHEKKPKSNEPSHYKEMEKLPVIGK